MLGLGIGVWLKPKMGGGVEPVVTFYILAESGDRMTTEAGDGLITE